MNNEPRRKRRSSQYNKDVSAQNAKLKKRNRALLFVGGLFAVVSGVTLTATGSADAGVCEDFLGNPIPDCNVPEISALEGTAALAVIAAMLLLAWERRTRA